MSAVDWIGWVVATAICLLLGWWLHRVGKRSPDTRIESLAIALGWVVLTIEAVTR